MLLFELDASLDHLDLHVVTVTIPSFWASKPCVLLLGFWPDRINRSLQKRLLLASRAHDTWPVFVDVRLWLKIVEDSLYSLGWPWLHLNLNKFADPFLAFESCRVVGLLLGWSESFIVLDLFVDVEQTDSLWCLWYFETVLVHMFSEKMGLLGLRTVYQGLIVDDHIERGFFVRFVFVVAAWDYWEWAVLSLKRLDKVLSRQFQVVNFWRGLLTRFAIEWTSCKLILMVDLCENVLD